MEEENPNFREGEVKSRDDSGERANMEKMMRDRTKEAWDKVKGRGPTKPEL